MKLTANPLSSMRNGEPSAVARTVALRACFSRRGVQDIQAWCKASTVALCVFGYLISPGVSWASACFIDRAVEHDGQLDLYIAFVDRSHTASPDPDRQFDFVASKGVIAIRSGRNAGKLVDHISLRLGDRAFLQGGADDRCALTIVSEHSKLGFNWSTTFTAPGGKPISQSGHENAVER